MAKVLYIQASATKDRSKSIEVADVFVEAYRQAHPGDSIETINLFDAELPTFDAPMAQAKYRIMHNQSYTPEERAAWDQVEKTIEHFKSADKYVFAVAMWNFGIPWRLKQYIDILVQPTYTFKTTEQGYEGLVTGRKAVAVYARGGVYGPGTAGEAYDMQKPYLELILGYIGIADVQSILVEPTLAQGPEEAKEAVRKGKEKARQLAAGF